MPMTARLAQTLQEKLGSEGAADMITWFDDTQRGARLLRWMIGLWIVTLSAMGVLKIVG